MSLRKVVELVQSSLEPLSEVAGEVAFNAVVGQVASGLVNARMAYKQIQFEKNMKTALEIILSKLDRLEALFNQLPHETQSFIRDRAFPLVFDMAMEETQEQKIEIIINGFENILENCISDENEILMYFDALKELRLIDIRRLLEVERNPAIILELHNHFIQTGEKSKKIGGERISASLSKTIDVKLERLDLVRITRPTTFDSSSWGEDSYDSLSTRLTEYGVRFLAFIRTETDSITPENMDA